MKIIDYYYQQLKYVELTCSHYHNCNISLYFVITFLHQPIYCLLPTPAGARSGFVGKNGASSCAEMAFRKAFLTALTVVLFLVYTSLQYKVKNKKRKSITFVVNLALVNNLIIKNLKLILVLSPIQEHVLPENRYLNLFLFYDQIFHQLLMNLQGNY